jgi:alkylation response protein AidB-like acyl-CoA dehydrogenase
MTEPVAPPALQLPYLTARHEAFRREARAHLQRIVLPQAEAWEAQGHISRDGWEALASQGLLQLSHAGEDFLYSAIFLEELGYLGYAGIRAAIAVHAYMALSYLRLFGTPEQQRTYLPDACRGKRIAALAITEAEAGSDLRHLQTYAQPQRGGGYRVSGRKCYVTNGSQADMLLVLVKTRETSANRGLSGAALLLLDANSPGLRRLRQPMLGWHSADICTIEMDDVRVPAQNLLGQSDRALVYLMRALDFERLVAGLLAVGGAAHCVSLLRQFVTSHQVKDAPLSANQVVRHRLAEMSSDLDLLRHYAYQAAWRHSQQCLDTRTAAILKLKSTEFATTAAQTCVQYHGARGYTSESAAARHYRDAVAAAIAAGPSELMRELIFEAEFGMG